MSLVTVLLQGGIALIPLGFCSVLIIAVIFERLWAYSRVKVMPSEYMHRVENLLSAGHWQEAIRLLDAASNPYSRVAKATLLRQSATKEEIVDVLTLACDEELAAASRMLPILGTIGNLAPFIGLFGTVVGIMEAFQHVAQQGAAGASVVSSGIAQALIATACGLAIAIFSLVPFNYFSARVTQLQFDLETAATNVEVLVGGGKTGDTVHLHKPEAPGQATSH